MIDEIRLNIHLSFLSEPVKKYALSTARSLSEAASFAITVALAAGSPFKPMTGGGGLGVIVRLDEDFSRMFEEAVLDVTSPSLIIRGPRPSVARGLIAGGLAILAQSPELDPNLARIKAAQAAVRGDQPDLPTEEQSG